jgi:RNA polymerase sigma-70 factor (ECF subfamily)
MTLTRAAARIPRADTLMVSEADLIARAARGEAEAFGALYERHLEPLYRYVYVRVGDVAEAEDLTEMVFLKAWEALGRYRADELRFRALLYRIAHNLIIDRHRTRRQEDSLDGAEGHGAEPRETEAGVIAKELANERTAALAAALARLEPLQQQVLALRFVSGLSHAETARVLGKSDGAVRVLQHRALASLRGLLGQVGQGSGDDGR